MEPQGIYMTWVTVKDFDKAKEFYTKTLGMTLQADSPEYQWAEVTAGNGVSIGISGCSENNPIQPGGNAVVCINVEDIVATKNELEAAGVRILGDITEVPGHVKMILIQDPSGNHFNIVQMLS